MQKIYLGTSLVLAFHNLKSDEGLNIPAAPMVLTSCWEETDLLGRNLTPSVTQKDRAFPNHISSFAQTYF